MKKIKNVMLLLVSGLVVTTLVTTSCKKDDGGGGGSTTPTISSVTPTSGLVGATVTITGTNLTGATVKFGTTAATTSAVSATSITCTVPAGLAAGATTITVTTSAGTATYAFTVTVVALSSNDVAAANLIAHWTFDNTKAEDKSGLAPSSSVGTTVNATGGQIGGYIGFANGYLVYPTIPNINWDTAFAGGFTFSAWAKFPTTTAATNLLTSLWQVNGNTGDIWGTAALTYRHAPNDTLDFDGTLTHVNGTGTHSTYADAFLQGAESGFKALSTSWVLVTMVYDTAGTSVGTSKLKYYGNGVLRGSKTIAPGVIPTNEQFELITTKSFGNTGRSNVTFGTFNYTPTPFAAGGAASAAWQNSSLPAGTAIDDARVFNKSLTATEITDLYNRGAAGN